MPPEIPFDRLILAAIEIAGTLAFAMSGLIEAARRRMDVVGVAAVSFFAAFGGGTLRDLLLDRRPFFWVQYDEYIWAVLVLAVLGGLGFRVAHLAPTARPMLWADALGLGLFAASGAGIASDLGQAPIVCALMGVVTAVFGGVMRDLLCGQVPVVFRDRRPYAVCAFAGAWIYLGVSASPIPEWAALLCGTGAAAGLRLLSLARNWQVPTLSNDE